LQIYRYDGDKGGRSLINKYHSSSKVRH